MEIVWPWYLFTFNYRIRSNALNSYVRIAMNSFVNVWLQSQYTIQFFDSNWFTNVLIHVVIKSFFKAFTTQRNFYGFTNILSSSRTIVDNYEIGYQFSNIILENRIFHNFQ